MPFLRSRWPVFVLAGCLLFLTANASAKDDLTAPLVEYFKSEDANQRQVLAERIDGLIAGDFDRLERALLTLPLWEAIEPGESTVTVPVKPGRPITVALRVPGDYDPRRAWPMIVALHGTNGKADEMRAFVADLLGELAEQFIIAAPQDLPGITFVDKEEVTAHPAKMLAFLRRHVHLDNDRVFLTGYSLGGHGAWVTGALYADHFAGVMPLAGSFYLPSRQYLWPLLVDNFRHTPVLACWGAEDVKGPDGKPSPTDGIAGANQRLLRLLAIHDASLPILGVEDADRGHGGIRPPADKLQNLLHSRRARYPKHVNHWFRHPAQGSAYWMKLTRFRGRPWDGGRIILKDVIGKNPKKMTAEIIAG
ncbi:unnamed protein product, partial [marine sediment metagenome]